MAVLLGAVLAGSAWGQSNFNLTGSVHSSDEGAPVQGAAVELTGTGYNAVTDQFGYFGFDNLPPGKYHLAVYAPGYADFRMDEIQIKAGMTKRVSIRIEPKLYYLDKIMVTETRLHVSSDRVEIINRREIEQTGARDLPQLLENVRGVYIQRAGTGGGQSRIRIRGSDPKYVLVLIDGQKINPSSSGVADLNSIPIEMIEQIEIYRGGASAEFGPDALGGVINIITHRKFLSGEFEADAEKTWGSWKTEINKLSLADFIPIENFSCKLAYQTRQAVGDFDYAYRVEPGDTIITGTRVNNGVDSYNYFASGIYRFSGRWNMAYSGQYYHSQSGLPGNARDQNLEATSTDGRRLFNLSLEYRGSSDRIYKLEAGYSRYEQLFKDLQSRTGFHTEYVNDIYSARYTQQHLIMGANRLRFGLEGRKDVLRHEDYLMPKLTMGQPERDNAGIFITDEQRFDVSRWFPADDMVLDAALRFDYTRTEKDSTSWQDTVKSSSISSWSPKVGIALSKGNRFSYIIRANYGKSLRLPSMNALFWKGDARSSGNPGLKPERSEHSEAGFEVTGGWGPIRLSGGINYFHSFLHDLVMWVPRSGVWRPENVEKAQITGHEDFIEIELLDRVFSFQYQNTITTALNKSTGDHTVYNKRLVFYPHYVTSFTARVNMKMFYMAYSIRMVDSAYTLRSNTKYYTSYRVDDIQAGVKIGLGKRWHLAGDFNLFNVRDEDYVLMANYPMPGREWNLGLKIIYGGKDTNQ